MDITFTGNHITVTPALQQLTTEKFSKLERHCDHIQNVQVIFSVEHLDQVVEGIINVPGQRIVASAKHNDMYTAIDQVLEKLDRQLKKYKEKSSAHRD